MSSRAQPTASASRRRASRSSALSASARNGSSVRSGHSSSMPSVKPGGGRRGTRGRGSRPRAISCSACPRAPSRLATSAAGSFARSPTEERPQRASVSTISASGSSFASGSGARNAASPPAGTATGESGSVAATRAASLLDASPQRAGSDSRFAAAIRARPRSRSSGKRRSRPSASRYTTPSPASSTRGDTVPATSRRASCAARSLSASRARVRRSGRSARACGSVKPGRMPTLRALRVAATTCAAVPFPSHRMTASSLSAGSLRSRAARGNSGTTRHARRGGTGEDFFCCSPCTSAVRSMPAVPRLMSCSFSLKVNIRGC